MKHIQEPWTFEDRSPEGVCHIRSADGHRMAVAPCADFASRIVACVNACAGIEDPDAEIQALRDTVRERAIKLARLRRVEGAARELLNCHTGASWQTREIQNKAFRALSSALEG